MAFPPTTSLAAAFSVRLAVSGYAGSCLRLRRTSDNVEQDIGFASGWVDAAAATAFLGGSAGAVTTWYDQTGNGHHLTQTTAANQCTWVPSRDSFPAVLNNFSNSHSFTVPATLTLDGRNSAVWVVGDMTFGAAALTIPGYTGLLRTNTGGANRTTFRSVSRTSPIEFTLGDAIYGLNLSVTACDMHSTEGVFAAAAQVAGTGAGGTFGAWGYMREVFFYTATMSAPNVEALKADTEAAYNLWGRSKPWLGQVAFDGDSIPTGVGVTGDKDSYPRKLARLVPGVRFHVFSSSGATTATLTTRGASVDASHDATLPFSVLAVHVGVNNVGVLMEDAATAYSNHVAYTAARTAAVPARQVWVVTVLACGGTGIQVGVDGLNARLRGTIGSGIVVDAGANRIVDAAALPEFNEAADTVAPNYHPTDRTHLADPGNTKMAERLALEPEFAAADEPPTITSAATKSGQVGVALSYTITATGTAPITFGVSGALPDGVTFDGTDTIAGTPTTAGETVSSITAENAFGDVESPLTFTIATPTLTGYTLTGPSSGRIGSARTFTWTLEPAGAVAVGGEKLTPAATDLTGDFTPEEITLTAGATSGTFTFTGSVEGSGTIGLANDQEFDEPDALAFTVTPSSTGGGSGGGSGFGFGFGFGMGHRRGGGGVPAGLLLAFADGAYLVFSDGSYIAL